MHVTVFSTKPYDRDYLEEANKDHEHELRFLETRLHSDTASLAHGAEAVCVFVNDTVDEDTIETLASLGVRVIATRSAGFNHIDLPAAHEHGLTVVRVPAYSPYAVAEHAVGLILTLNRKLHRSYVRVREGNFSLAGLMGFDLHGRTVGVVGTGTIGTVFARIMTGFGCDVVAFDPAPNDTCRELGVEYVDLETLLERADIVSLHCPLTP
ncbi:MAG: NAD(P)-dependent oxidoreductase, partial [Nitriliruptorales bacterium]|nr:NAD(P)-dependent oxidoreductase [Nitriliruptorales bacterium]